MTNASSGAGVRTSQAALACVVLLLAGGLGGWALRGWRDRAFMEKFADATFRVQLSTGYRTEKYLFNKDPENLPTAEEHEALLRCIAYDPEAVAAPATIRDVLRSGGIEGWTYKIELDTPKGSFRAQWVGKGVPEVGRKGELFGRVAEWGQLAGTPTLLDPAWLEPAGTIARLDKRPQRGP
jgi:hypothetical protein